MNKSKSKSKSFGEFWGFVTFTDYGESSIDAALSFIKEHIQSKVNFQVLHDKEGFHLSPGFEK